MKKGFFKMNLSVLSSLWIALTLSVGCNKNTDTGEEPTRGVLTGFVFDISTGNPLVDAKIIVFDANTNAPVGVILTSDIEGKYYVELVPGSYYIKAYRQGYEAVPPVAVNPISFSVIAGETSEKNIQMLKDLSGNTGIISGRSLDQNGNAVAGALIIAENESGAYSSLTDSEGNYFIFNVPEGLVDVKAWISGYNSSDVSVSVVAGHTSEDINLTLSAGTSGLVQGKITFLATENREIDVTLTHPTTQETIPGLATMTSNSEYTISNVPDGTYLARATYQNDTKVMDPDWILKNGEPYVTLVGNTVQRDFSVTGSLALLSPTNNPSRTEPVFISTTKPTFSWEAYPSASDYVIEVTDAGGRVIWGGLNESGDNLVKNTFTSETNIAYNVDNNAIEPLKAGQLYRWKIYVSKNDNQEAVGWKLISASEDQTGLFVVAIP